MEGFMKAKAEWRIMGVVNTTPDSFSDGGRYLDPATAVAHGLKLAEDGLVADERRASGRGRPAVFWHLSEKGQARFPDTHAALTVEILRSISGVLFSRSFVL